MGSMPNSWPSLLWQIRVARLTFSGVLVPEWLYGSMPWCISYASGSHWRQPSINNFFFDLNLNNSVRAAVHDIGYSATQNYEFSVTLCKDELRMFRALSGNAPSMTLVPQDIFHSSKAQKSQWKKMGWCQRCKHAPKNVDYKLVVT
jgi:hypothetical protein